MLKITDTGGRWVQTDMGNDGAHALGMEKAEIPVAESVGGMIKVVCHFVFLVYWHIMPLS